MDKNNKIFDYLISTNYIPVNGGFEISESLLAKYIKCYDNFFGSNDGKGLRRVNQKSFARKMAGLSLLKLNFNRGVKFNEISAGLIYVIGNPSFSQHYKIGMTIDLNTRLSCYQTYDPLRQYHVVQYDFVLQRKLVEKQILNHELAFQETGEWLEKKNALNLFDSIAKYKEFDF